MDLRVPEMEDGLGLIRTVKDRVRPQGRARSQSGRDFRMDRRPAQHARRTTHVDCVLPKPVRMEMLLRSIARAGPDAVPMPGGRAVAGARETFRFSVKRRAEVVANLEMSSPGSNWAETGREAALADAHRRRAPRRSTSCCTPAIRHYTYAAFLGELSPGEHELRVERDARYSAPESGLKVLGGNFRRSPPAIRTGPRSRTLPFSTLAPTPSGVSTIFRCSLTASGSIENGQPLLQYTMIFSNEDGGTSTRALMARWGRTTDVEYIYRAWLDAARRGRRAPPFRRAITRKSRSAAGARARIPS